jgi:hypothetical protein
MTSIPAYEFPLRNWRGKSSDNYCIFDQRLYRVNFTWPEQLHPAAANIIRQKNSMAAKLGMHIPPDAKRCKSTTSDEGLVF